MNNELNYSNEDFINLKFTDFNKTVIMSYNNILLKFLSDLVIINDNYYLSSWNITTQDFCWWNLNDYISKVRNILRTRDLEGMTNDLEIISIPKKASKFYFTNPLRRPYYET